LYGCENGEKHFIELNRIRCLLTGVGREMHCQITINANAATLYTNNRKQRQAIDVVVVFAAVVAFEN